MTSTMTTNVAATLRTIIDELSAEYVERETTLRNGVLALLARQHHMVVGPIGAAKSAAHEAIASRITGANFFATQMHDAMKTDEVFGQIDMPRYDAEGRWLRNTTGYLPEAHLAMIDEIDKGQHLLRSLLRVANERKWRNGDHEVDLPLITMVASANDVLEESLLPVWDRFLVRETVSYIAEADNFRTMLLGGGKVETPTTISLEQLQSASTWAVPAVTIPDDVITVVWTLRGELSAKGVIASDRRWKDSMRLLQARAFLAGRASVSVADVTVLRHVLWSTPEQEEVVVAQLVRHVDDGGQELGRVVDGLREIVIELDALEGQARSRRTQASADIATKLSRFRTMLRESTVDELSEEREQAVRAWRRARARMNVVCMGLAADKARAQAERAWLGAE